MAEISRLRDTEISNGNLINADDLDTEFNQLVDESNAQHDRLTTLESGVITLTGTKTFGSAPKLDSILEKTTGAGITVEQIKLKQGSIVLNARIAISLVDAPSNQVTTNVTHNLTTATEVEVATDGVLPSPLSGNTSYYVRVIDSDTVTLHPTASDASANTNVVDITTTGTGNHALLCDPASPVDGELWYNKPEEKLKFRKAGTSRAVLVEGEGNAFPKYHVSGPPPVYVSASSVKIPAGLSCRNKLDDFNIVFTADQTVSLASTGVNGLDAGAESGNDWYFLYAIADSTGVNSPKGMFSSINEAASGSVTMPSGYDKKRQLPIVIRNDGSSNIIPFTVVQWPNRTYVKYEVLQAEGGAATVGPTNVLDGGTASSYTNVSLAAFVPPLSRLGMVRVQHAAVATPATIYLKNAGASTDEFVFKQDGNRYDNQILEIETDSSQELAYKVTSSAACDLSVVGYIITETV